MLRIGVTGNSGAGKSVVSKMISDSGIPLYDVDVRCKSLIREERGLRANIVDMFGAYAYLQNGDYNSKFVASIVFNDKEKKRSLEKAVGKFMMADYDKWLLECKKLPCPFVIVDCAYFYELGMEDMVDLMVGVNAPLPIRMERIMKRDGITSEQANDRIRNQMDQDEKMSKCHFVLDTGGEFIDTKSLNVLVNQLVSFGHICQNLDFKCRNLVARGIAYGMGIGESKNQPINKIVNSMQFEGWENMCAVGSMSIEEEPDIESINEAIKNFFENNGIIWGM